jgi:hypothetical protein
MTIAVLGTLVAIGGLIHFFGDACHEAAVTPIPLTIKADGRPLLEQAAG